MGKGSSARQLTRLRPCPLPPLALPRLLYGLPWPLLTPEAPPVLLQVLLGSPVWYDVLSCAPPPYTPPEMLLSDDPTDASSAIRGLPPTGVAAAGGGGGGASPRPAAVDDVCSSADLRAAEEGCG
jgi:hypothetical protein